MSQTKYKLPDDLKMQCISLVRGYERRVLLYHERRNTVLYSSPPPNIISLKKETGEIIVADIGGRSGKTGDSTYSKALRLEKIEQLFDTYAMKAVEQARITIGVDYEDEEQRRRLADAIWDSCIEGRNFKFEYYQLPIGGNNFYERRRRFLYQIAKNMDFI